MMIKFLSPLAKSFLFILVLQVSSPATAQIYEPEARSEFSRTSFYFEFRGNALGYSLNFDHRFIRQASIRAGISVIPAIFTTTIIAPVMVNYLAGRGDHFLEMGAGVLVGTGVSGFETSSSVLLPTATVGYRWQPTDGGFLVRAGFTPGFNPSQINFIVPSGGVSIGYTF